VCAEGRSGSPAADIVLMEKFKHRRIFLTLSLPDPKVGAGSEPGDQTSSLSFANFAPETCLVHPRT
jgi:hypothetical protein